MILYSNDDDSDSQKESDFLSVGGEDADVYLNHYRIPKLSDYGSNREKNAPKGSYVREQIKYNHDGKIMSLTELAAQKVACHLPFGLVEHYDPPVPEPMQCRIAFWSFPQDEEDIRLYTCLANGNPEVFIRAEELISLNCVCDMLQVGFHLSANVKFIQDDTNNLDFFRVAITFDRRRIISCSCSCSESTFWCRHAVAVCLQRIRQPQEVTLRAPVSESLQRLEKNQLQKFAQYLINELPQQILPAAQRLLDELLSGDEAIINQNPAAPDPTAGATINEQTSWCLDDTHLSMDIRKILNKQCISQPTVCSDVQALHVTAPPAATEYNLLLRPIRGREPEGLWNLISIVGEMMRRRDSNFYLLLEIMTEEVLKCDKVVTWWFETMVSLYSGTTIHYANSKHSTLSTSQHSCSNFCVEIVHLWRLAAMNPSASTSERRRLYKKFFDWHLEILNRHSAIPDQSSAINVKNSKRNYLELFPGFRSAMEGCLIDWSDWDDKKGLLITEPPADEAETTKPSKSSKKRKKKSKASKQSATEEKLSNLSQENGQAEESIAGTSSTKSADEHQSTNHERSNMDDKENVVTLDRVSSNEVLENNPIGEEQLEPLQRIEDPDQLNIEPNVEPDLQVYFMERPPDSPSKPQKPVALEDLIKVNARRLNDPLETMYSKVEGLYAHGHIEEARILAHRVANEILKYPNYPTIKQLFTLTKRRKKRGTLDNQMSIVASEALSKITFLCNVLLDDTENHNLVFRLVMFGVEMKRSPASTKPLEVKLINQKHDLILLLKSVPLHETELIMLREKAQAIRDGVYENISDALTTLMLGNYIFEALVLSKSPACSNNVLRPALDTARNNPSNSYNQPGQYQLEDHYLPPVDMNQPPSCELIRHACPLNVYGKIPLDTSLGFHAALNAISAKVNLLEADHPLLCEGTRRQRGELALSLLTYYKDDQEKLDLILKHLLDKDVVLSLNKADLPERTVTKKGSSSQDPCQPTEASAHFMFDLAKSVFDKAGGNSNMIHLFRPQLYTQNGGRGIHKKLHMCALRIALYSLGLENRGVSNWMARTYNGRASFVNDQALEIGLPAFKFLCENWEGYLTPVEAATIADKAAARSDDPETKRVAAEIGKSCLKFVTYLDFNAVRRILTQCKEQSKTMIEEACREIERVTEKGDKAEKTEKAIVCADVLFATARSWYDLYKPDILTDGCCTIKENLPVEHDNGATGWLDMSNPGQDKYQQYEPIYWDHYGRVDWTGPPAIYTSTYKHIECINAAFRVGIKALNALQPPPHIGSKLDSNKEEDVLWLFGLSKDLGQEYLHTFSRSVIARITNPYLLHHICSDLTVFFRNLPADHADRVNILLPLIDKCLDRFAKYTRDLMKHFSYDQCHTVDSILNNAKNLTETANTLTAAGHFKELLKHVDNQHSKNKMKNKKARNLIETSLQHKWIDGLLDTIKTCICPKCRTGREMSINILASSIPLNQRAGRAYDY